MFYFVFVTYFRTVFTISNLEMTLIDDFQKTLFNIRIMKNFHIISLKESLVL